MNICNEQYETHPFWQRIVGIYASGFALTSVPNVTSDTIPAMVDTLSKHAGIFSEDLSRI